MYFVAVLENVQRLRAYVKSLKNHVILIVTQKILSVKTFDSINVTMTPLTLLALGQLKKCDQPTHVHTLQALYID